MWDCPFKFPKSFYVLLDKDGEIASSAEDRETLEVKRKGEERVEVRNYEGCPAFSFDKGDDLL